MRSSGGRRGGARHATGRIPWGRALPRLPLLCACLLHLAMATPAVGAAPVIGPAPEVVRPPVEVNNESVIRKIRFHFTGTHEIDAAELKRHLTLIPRLPVSGLRRALSYLPFVNDAGAPGLVPLELQRDVIRIRALYRDAGFPHATISYQVSPSGHRMNTFDIDFDIAEGAPMLVGAVAFTDSAGAPLTPPATLRSGYEDRLRLARRLVGARLSTGTLTRLEGRMAGWWRDRGYPLAVAHTLVEVDSLKDRAELRLAMTPGPFTRIREVRVTGIESLHPDVIRRELPFRPGDTYAARQMAEGQRELQGLPIVRLALVGVPDSAVVDSGVVVLARITEGKARLLSGELGYVTDGGLQTQLSASHNNFFGGARTLTLSGVARPGTLALEPGTLKAAVDPDRLYRGSLSLQQPYVFDRRLSFVGGPFAEYRKDLTGRYQLFGGNATLIYSMAPLRNITLQYEVSRKRVLEYSLSSVDLVTRLGLGQHGIRDSLEGRINLARLGLSATAGVLDNTANPRRGIVVRPAFTLTVPAGMNSNEYARLDATATGFYPLGRQVGLMMRVTGGRLFPYGRSLPAAGEDGFPKYLGFRDAAFTAGGSDDVRGWANRLLGPKYPDIRERASADSAGKKELYAVGYVPLGGLNRVSGSIEMRLPFPGLGADWGTFTFLDAGRVWTDDLRFSGPDLGVQQQSPFYAVGAGFDWKTLVGAVRFQVGYKLNPSALDEIDAQDALRAIVADEPVGDLPRHRSRRWQFHLSIGTGF